MESLTERVLRFQETGQGGEEIVREVACRVYEFPRRTCQWDEEASSEFFARVFPKVRGMIARFRDIGRPFESYLASMLLFQVKTCAQHRYRRDLEWKAAADPELWGVESAEDTAGSARGAPEPVAGGASRQVIPGVCADRDRAWPAGDPWRSLSAELRRLLGVEEGGVIRSPFARRRFLVVCLKSAHLLTDADVAGIATMTRCGESELHDAVERLRARHHERLARLELFTGRRNKAFSELRLTQTRLCREVDPERRLELERKSKRLTKTLRSCQLTISRIRLGPSHRQIAEELGMPKASVDSTIHRLKQRAAAFYPAGHEEYA